MDENRPLFITFKPFGEDGRAKAKPAPDTAPRQPQGTEQWPGQHRHGRGSPGLWSPPPAQSLPEGELEQERVVLRARTRLWFEQTQAQRLGPKGELPAWFHGFISRREAEELLQDQPLGCFLVRFSESTIGFVLSYRGRDRCRHFVLEQLPDGRYAILGEHRAHADVAALLQHHARAPVPPYPEFLTVALQRGQESEPRGRSQPADAALSPLSEAAAKFPEHGPVSPERPGAQGGFGREVPSSPPALPARSSSRAAALGQRSPSSSAPEAPPAQGHKGAAPSPDSPDSPDSPESRYEQLVCLHVYAEPREQPGPEEPIPFYAMARGRSPGDNIYSEVALARQGLPPAPQNAFSTLPPKPRPHRRLFRSVSSQECRRRQLLVAPSEGRDRGAPGTGTEVTLNAALELDDPVYSQSRARDQQTTAVAENIYERLPGDCP